MVPSLIFSTTRSPRHIGGPATGAVHPETAERAGVRSQRKGHSPRYSDHGRRSGVRLERCFSEGSRASTVMNGLTTRVSSIKPNQQEKGRIHHGHRHDDRKRPDRLR